MRFAMSLTIFTVLFMRSSFAGFASKRANQKRVHNDPSSRLGAAAQGRRPEAYRDGAGLGSLRLLHLRVRRLQGRDREGAVAHLRRYRSEAGGYRLFRKHGFKTIEDALGSVLEPCAVLTARRGDLGVVERDGVLACCVVTAMGAMVRVDHGRGFEYWPQDAMKTAFRVG